MDYTNEVPHPQAEGLLVRGAQPFNAEPPASALVDFGGITPEELIYCRNHSPIFDLDENTYTVKIDDKAGEGLVKRPTEFTIDQLRTEFKHVKVIAALQCAGNRRQEMAQIEPVKGIIWDCGVIANCEWSGVRLRDVLIRAGVEEEDLDDTHVWFASNVSICQDDKNYGGSVPLRKAMDPLEDVILCLDMNGQPLSPDHGYPLRAVVPGYTGARWVKWVDHITVSRNESPNFYQQRDYRILPPHVKSTKDAAPVWDTVKSITSLPVNSIISSVRPIPSGERRLVKLKGYAMGEGGFGKQIKKVQIAVDNGDADEDRVEWVETRITYQDGPWSWTLWEGTLDLSAEEAGGKRELTLLCRAEDEQGVAQKRQCAWNMRGVAFNAYGKAIWSW